MGYKDKMAEKLIQLPEIRKQRDEIVEKYTSLRGRL